MKYLAAAIAAGLIGLIAYRAFNKAMDFEIDWEGL